MEKIDRELQQRVWQRVQSKPGEQPPQTKQENLKAWILAAQENEAAYRQLAKQYGGRQGEQLRTMARQVGSCVACARGICRMRGERVKALPLPTSTDRHSPEKCYHREVRLWQETESRASDPEYGPVYRHLAAQAAQRCVILAGMIGGME